MKSIIKQLQQELEGAVYTDSVTRRVYSIDASIFEIEPTGVIVPKTKTDLVTAVKILSESKIPMTVRGAATGITGGCLGKGFIIDLSTYFNHIHHIQIQDRYVLCEPGVVQDELNTQLAPFGYRLGPDTSTGNRATLGGMLANNAAGARSLRYGKMVDHIQEVELLLAGGELIRFSAIDEVEWQKKRELKTQEGEIYRQVWLIKQEYGEEIKARFPSIPRRVSGYNLDELMTAAPLNISKLIAGSEGTLGIVTDLKLSIVPKTKETGLCLIHFHDMLRGMRAVPDLLRFNPLSLEMIDNQIIELGRASPSLRGVLEWLKGHPQAIFIIELEGENQQDVKQQLENVFDYLRQNKIGDEHTLILDPEQMTHVWKLRKAGLGILLSKRTYSRAIAFLEDITVSPYRLADFMEKFCTYLKQKGKWAGIYGHVGSGCMHIRPYINLQQPEEYQLMHQMMLDISDLLLEYHGALSGEHGDGLIRSWLNPKMFGPSLMKAFKKLKTAFDPHSLMNPGKIVDAAPPFAELRTQPNEKLIEPSLFLNFAPEGGFALAVDLCNGNGLCRKKENVMCPSFQVTNKEFHSTRARAQALRGIVHGRLPLEEWTSHQMHEVMDLCISCKGCKTECPSQVDLAKLKAEFSYHYQQKHGYSLRSRLFAHIGQLNQWMSSFSSLINQTSDSRLAKWILSQLDITTKRPFPHLARKRFSKWFKNYQQSGLFKRQVVLLNDTFTEFNHPEIGQAAVKILNALDYEAIVLPWSCCGRPAISKGFLPLAKQQAEDLTKQLIPYALAGIPIIGLEPSCILTVKDDYQGLNVSHSHSLESLSRACLTWDEFLAIHLHENGFNLPFKGHPQRVKVHGHCHQKSLVGMAPTMDVLKAIPNLEAMLIASGCCGMAGSFGYEAEHYDLSMEIGELQLLPTIRKSSQEILIIANGTSCRQQILDGTGRKAVHLAEALWLSLKHEDVSSKC